VSTRHEGRGFNKKACEAHIVLVVGHPCFPIRCYMWHSVVAAVTLPACLPALPGTLARNINHFLWPPCIEKSTSLNAINVYVIYSGMSVMEGTFSLRSLYMGICMKGFHDISMLVQYKLV